MENSNTYYKMLGYVMQCLATNEESSKKNQNPYFYI